MVALGTEIAMVDEITVLPLNSLEIAGQKSNSIEGDESTVKTNYPYKLCLACDAPPFNINSYRRTYILAPDIMWYHILHIVVYVTVLRNFKKESDRDVWFKE